MHPGIENLKDLTDVQIEQKLSKLNSIYFITDNDSVRQQMILLIDTFKLELEERRVRAKFKREQDGKDDLDNLIRVR
tara:strand:+ start:5282 stop:5512 length:231 start_codon:yes stop_codon:yes gene_type:complete